MWDIIPDIHGQADKLEGLLKLLGYREARGAWRHSDNNRSVIFLGDFIDRGPENAKVIRIVRSMIDAGAAQAIMGNHELNAIHFHTNHHASGEPLRQHSSKNMEQHGRFLAEHPVGSSEAADAVAWMKTLPLYIEFDDFRVVHACWNAAAMESANRYLENALLVGQAVEQSADSAHPLYKALEVLAKGPEIELPDSKTFRDKDGYDRPEIRAAWWKSNAQTWQDIAICVPDPETQLPDEDLPASARSTVYPGNEKPVFFGHYWLEGDIELQAHNALCLDYSAGKEGPLVSYCMTANTPNLDLARITALDPGDPEQYGGACASVRFSRQRVVQIFRWML